MNTNNKLNKANSYRVSQELLRNKALRNGVNLIAPETIFLCKDTRFGKNSNIGAGTITCNYDGVKKLKTKISDNVFVGSNSSLVAPINLEKNSTIGAGSVITEKVKKGSLAITRSNQLNIKNYKRNKKKRENNVWNNRYSKQ